VTPGYVLFRLGEHTFAAALDEVREIVRMTDLQRLPGVRPPLSGVVIVRGAPLPVLDARKDATAGENGGDILVMEAYDDTIGVAVDAVTAVVGPEELPETEAPGKALPPYVIGVRRRGEQPILLVDLRLMLAAQT
jgi:chemotaxis signal transduction protein